MIGDIIKRLLDENDLTQLELAEKLDINKSVLNRIISGERPARDIEILTIASFFNVSTDYLLELTNNPTERLDSSEVKEKKPTATYKWIARKAGELKEEDQEKLMKMIKTVFDYVDERDGDE